MRISFKILILATIVLTSCSRNTNDDKTILIDFDLQKKININIPNIILDANAFSGKYLTFADSTSPYGFGISSNLEILGLGSDVKNLNISAQIKRSNIFDLGTIAFQILNKNGENIFNQSVYITEANFSNANEWTKIEGLITLPNDVKIYEEGTNVKIFLFATKGRILVDDLEIKF